MLVGCGKATGLLRFAGFNFSRPPIRQTLRASQLIGPYARPSRTQRMLHRAVADHDGAASRPKPLAQQLFPSSSPTQASSQIATNRNRNLGTSILQLKNSSSLNTANQRPVSSQHYRTAGIKRTSSGLAKALGKPSVFESDTMSNSQHNPIKIDENSPVKSKAPTVPQSQYFNEDDFDSDIDLDIEDPAAKGNVQYPTLPKLDSVPSKAFYPTLPRQQAVATHQSTAFGDEGYGGSNDLNIVSPSSVPFPWSSSPAERKMPNLDQFQHAEPVKIDPRTSKTSSLAVKEEAKPAKKRTIPWAKTDEQVEQAHQNGPPPVGSLYSTASTKARHVQDTPNSKSFKSNDLWNPTASVVKQQQKTLREANNKKKTKYEEAMEHSMEVIRSKSSKKRVARVFLSEEQQHVLNLVVESKKSVFFTGSAGTGKSVLLREIIAALRKKHIREPDRIAVTASTGLAACNIGGVTLHSFAGIGLGKEDTQELVKKIKRNQKAKHRWMRTKILVVDEVSMLDGDLFDKLEAIARSIRNNGRAFGGIQLVITGDFFQLPPVPDNNKVATFAFDAHSWNTAISHTIGLHHVFRQKDPVFAGMLNEMREGRLSQSSITAFQKLTRPLDRHDEIVATELFPTRNEVEAANRNRMGMLVGDTMTFEARDGGQIMDKVQRDKVLSNCMAAETINLKKGAQVMLIKNIDETLVNGSIGKVVSFKTLEEYDLARASNTPDDEEDAALANMSELDANFLRTKKAAERIRQNLLASTTQRFPEVEFLLADGTKRRLLVEREQWKVELPNGEIQASRSQIPLILAWALSIHKAQGQTLERVRVDLGKVFEKGQAYVALSRATSMAGLQVLRFDPKKVSAHEKVRTFYQNLSRVETLDTKAEPDARRKRGFSAEEYEEHFLGGDF